MFTSCFRCFLTLPKPQSSIKTAEAHDTTLRAMTHSEIYGLNTCRVLCVPLRASHTLRIRKWAHFHMLLCLPKRIRRGRHRIFGHYFSGVTPACCSPVYMISGVKQHHGHNAVTEAVSTATSLTSKPRERVKMRRPPWPYPHLSQWLAGCIRPSATGKSRAQRPRRRPTFRTNSASKGEKMDIVWGVC